MTTCRQLYDTNYYSLISVLFLHIFHNQGQEPKERMEVTRCTLDIPPPPPPVSRLVSEEAPPPKHVPIFFDTDHLYLVKKIILTEMQI